MKLSQKQPNSAQGPRKNSVRKAMQRARSRCYSATRDARGKPQGSAAFVTRDGRGYVTDPITGAIKRLALGALKEE